MTMLPSSKTAIRVCVMACALLGIGVAILLTRVQIEERITANYIDRRGGVARFGVGTIVWGIEVPLTERLEAVYLEQCDIVEKDLSRIASLTMLKELHVSGSSLNDAGLAELSSLNRLRYLDVSGTTITNKGLARLKTSRNLRYVDLSETNISDAGIVHLQGNKRLNRLIVDNTAVSCNLGELSKKFPRVNTISCGGTQTTDSDLKHKKGELSGLMELSLHDTRISDQGMGLLCSPVPPALEFLDLRGTDVTDKSVGELGQIDSLKNLWIVGTDISEAGARRLQELLPYCYIDVVMNGRDIASIALQSHD